MTGAAPIILVNMPLAAVERPCLALGLLQSVLARAGLDSRVAYANMWFLEYAGIADHLTLEGSVPEEALVDWLFAGAAFPDFASDHDAFLADYFRRNPAHGQQARALEPRFRLLRQRMPLFIDWAVDKILAQRPAMVGCTSTFQQNVAALALLRRLRERAPGIVTLMGGANCETRMGRTNHRHFDWVDYVVSGEADGFIAPLCADILKRGRDIPAADLPVGVFGPAHRETGYPATTTGDLVPRAVTEDMRDLPLPDFSDYFTELGNSLYAGKIDPGIPMEFSRGCWWGERSHCTFCGLNGGSMSYRQKPARQAAEEIATMAERYNSTRIEAVDNILAIDYFDEALPQLAAREDKLSLFFEVKANLKRHEVQKLADAGVRWIQPGVESLDSRVLKLIAKGTTAAHNVQLLKWCRQYGVRLSWNMLWGFPKEQDDWYAGMAEWLPALHHLQPGYPVRLRIHRYSPYFQKPEAYGLKLKPATPFRHVYPLAESELFDLVYCFEDANESDGGRGMAGRGAETWPGLHRALRAIGEWLRAWNTPKLPMLQMRDDAGVLVVEDSRAVAMAPEYRFSGVEKRLLLAADDGAPETRTRERLLGEGIPAGAIDEALATLVERKLVLRLDGRLVGIALWQPYTLMPAPATFPGGYFDRREMPLAAE